MRYAVESAARPKSVAKSLKKHLANEGVVVGLVKALSLVAQMYGYTNWDDLFARIGKDGRGLPDHEVGPEEAVARRARYIGVLCAAGVAENVAVKVIDAVGPTSEGKAAIAGPDLRRREGAAALLKRIAQAIAAMPDVRLLTAGGYNIVDFADDGRRECIGVSWDGRHVVTGESKSIVDEVSDDTIFISRGDLSDFLRDRRWREAVERFDEPLAVQIGKILSRLDLDVLVALRRCDSYDALTYEAVACDSAGLRETLDQWPCLADVVYDAARGDILQSVDRPGHALLNGGLVGLADYCAGSRGEGYKQKIWEVLMALRGQESTDDIYNGSLHRMVATGFVPRSADEWKAFKKASDALGSLEGFMPIERVYAGFAGSWVDFCKKLDAAGGRSDGDPSRISMLVVARQDATEVIVAGFALAYGLDIRVVTDQECSRAFDDRLFKRVFKVVTGLEFVKSMREQSDAANGFCPRTAEEVAVQMAAMQSMLPLDLRGLDAVGVVRALGYDAALLAGMLLEEPDLDFDEDGAPVVDAAFEGRSRDDIAARRVDWAEFPDERRMIAVPAQQLPVGPDTETPPGWRRLGEAFYASAPFGHFRLRRSDGRHEVVEGTPGWWLDGGHFYCGEDGKFTDQGSFPMRLGSFVMIDNAISEADRIRLMSR